MKYVIEWKLRPGGSNAENEAAAERSLQIFSKWEPAAKFIEFVSRVDNGGGFAVVEADDPSQVMKDTSKFGSFLDFTVYPVIDIAESIAILQEANDYRSSIS